MHRILAAVLLVVCSSSASAAQYFILTPRRLLNEQEQADLASRGLAIERPVTGGRFLVRISDGATVADDDPRIASLAPLTAERKLDRTAMHAIASGKPAVVLDVLFHDDAPFAGAKAVIENAGGSLAEPLQSDFHVPRRISIRIAPAALTALASDDRVLLVYGSRRLTPRLDNANSAALSNVTPLYTAPYNLTGQGVVLSSFELAEADATHREFEGRLTTHTTGGPQGDRRHATHVAGTMIAAGLDPKAKGMAPAATLHEFDSSDETLLDFKLKLPSYSVVADNNSWGYIIGWCNGNQCVGWVWSGNELYHGGYSTLYTAPLDKITRATGVLMVHSAGNDADKVGPDSPPFLHAHFEDDGTIGSGYCYSADGSGTDCPLAACKHCEIKRHLQMTELLPPPWISIGVTASAKNVIAVGAVDIHKQIADYSSRGPARDGRVKPDLVARGGAPCPPDCVYSTSLNNSYEGLNGTSMAAPVVTGTAALLVEQWRRTFGGQNPTPAALKTLMIATADDLGNAGPDYTYGFGLLNAKAAVDTIVAGRRILMNSVASGDQVQVPVSVNATQNLRVVLGWSDPEVLVFPIDSGDPTDPLAAQTLVNDLDVKVVDPNGNEVLPYVLSRDDPGAPATRGVNKVDNTEEVEIPNAGPGTYKVMVTGSSVMVASPQDFVLVANADLGTAAKPCTEPFGPTSTPDSAYGNLVATQTITGRTCDQTDVDYFKFLVDKSGPVTVTVTATDTPVRVTLTSSATSPVRADIAAGATQTLTTSYSGTTGTEFFARIEPIGTIGATSRYKITPNFSSAQHGRRRSVRRAH